MVPPLARMTGKPSPSVPTENWRHVMELPFSADELCDLHLFVRGQFFDLLKDFKRTHGLIIRQNLFLASRIACGRPPQNDFGSGINALMPDHQARPLPDYRVEVQQDCPGAAARFAGRNSIWL